MTRDHMPIISCDGDDGYCGAVETDYYEGLASAVDGAAITSSHRAPGWSSIGDEDYCPEHAPADVEIHPQTTTNGAS